MMNKILCFLCFLFVFNLHAENHAFSGDHLIATYYDCDDHALNNLEVLKQVMQDAVKATGATILDAISHQFVPQGFSMVILVSESHASIHTYPEYHSCFVDIFTCGQCNVKCFDLILQKYLKPKKVRVEYLIRS